MLFVMGLNHHFKEQSNRRKYRNFDRALYTYDSLIVVKLDSVLTVHYESTGTTHR